MTITVDMQDNGLMAALSGMQNLAPLTNGLVAGAEYLRTQVMRYPTQFSHRHTPEWTPTQRRWFFWALRTGQIQVPYVRSQALATSWEVQAQGLRATVGTTVSYAPLVKSERITMYHRITGHETVTFTTQQAEQRIFELFNLGVAQWVA